MKPGSHLYALTALLFGMAAAPLFSQTFTYNNGGGDGLWSTPANWSGSLAYPDAVGALATMAVSSGFSTTLDVNATVSALRNTAGSARVWTHTNPGGFTLTLDGTGFTNGFGNANTAEIRATSSGGIVSAANLILRNTNLDIGTTGSTNSNAQVTISGTISAETNQTITVRNNRRQTNLQGEIGAGGTGEITLINLSSGTLGDNNQLNISGNLGPRVVQLTQGVGVTAGMVISGPNPAFTGDVSILANSITVGATGTLGNSNTITISDGANLILQNGTALGSDSALVINELGTSTLSYTGTMVIGSLSLNGGLFKVAGGTVWGAIGSGAANETSQLLGTGLVQVAAADNPDADGDGLDDAWEVAFFGGTAAQNDQGDPDGDGFNNLLEQTGGSNPNLTASTPGDIDGDDLGDTWEITHFGNRAQGGAGDPDGDGATNLAEYAGGINSTSPVNAALWPDTDGDSLNDAWEIIHFGSLTAAAGSGDADGDGANNVAEMGVGSDPNDVNWTPTHAVLAHRWSFDGDLLDSVGASHATIVDPDANPDVGGTVTQGATDITLAGGPSASSAAVRLGSNLVGGLDSPITIEIWATHNAVQNWGRIFDFGSSTTEYLFMSWTQGTNAAQDQVEWVDANVTSRVPNTNAPYTLGEKYHIVLTLTPATYTNGALASGTRVTWYSATVGTTGLVAKGTFDTVSTLANLNDLDDWIGRSMWAGDNVASATYDEVRIWAGALTNDEVNTYQLAGPTAFGALSDLQAWRQTYFSSPENTGNGADAFDADNDGIANLIEYATGTLPTETDSSAPVTLTQVGNFLNLTFNHIDDPTLSYVVEAGSDLAAWTAVGTYTGFGSNGATTYIDNVDLSAAGVRRFLRLKITP